MSPAALAYGAWWALGLAGLALAAELAARAWMQRFGHYYVWPPYARIHMATDREAMPELEPLVRVEINREGERGGAVPLDWRNTYRVLVAGGSVAECWFIDQPSSWPQVIERCLNEPASLGRLGVARAHVGSIARSLVACEHIDLMLRRVFPRYPRLDAIVFMVGASDLVHWLEQGAPTAIEPNEVGMQVLFGQHPEPPFGWTPRTLALRRLASYWRRRLQRRIAHREHSGRRIADARAARGRAVRILREVPDPGPMLDRFEKNLRELLTRAQNQGARVIVARQPWLEKEFTPEEEKHLWMFRADKPSPLEATGYYAHELVWKLMGQVDARTSKVAAEMGVEQIDLRPVVPPTFDLWYDEMHHNARGCDRIGRAIARVILEGP